MPSLIPKLQPVVPDLRAVFASEKTAATLSRVLKFVGHYYKTFSNRSEADRYSPFYPVEEFDLLMPTEKAFADELALCGAILDHAAGRLTDDDIKAVLAAFVESHLYVYRNGQRAPKVGADVWAACPLVYVYEPCGEIAFTCNPVQSWMICLLHRDINLRVLRLN